MSALEDTVPEDLIAAAFGVLGLACQLTWPLFRVRHAMLAAQLGAAASYAMHYALLGAWSGAGVATLGAVQSAIVLLAGGRRSLGWLGAVFLPLVTVICVTTWNGAASLLALTACSLAMVCRMQQDTIRLRLFLLSAAPFGIGHDLVIGAVPALVGAVVSACVAATMLAREVAHPRRKSFHAAATAPTNN